MHLTTTAVLLILCLATVRWGSHRLHHLALGTLLGVAIGSTAVGVMLMAAVTGTFTVVGQALAAMGH
ncbi:MAG: hypothetical protein JWO67_3171 [Streptosporangiaceae bacterium]|nr:hypothetical protein [Streptosporangiaceae bacterium]